MDEKYEVQLAIEADGHNLNRTVPILDFQHQVIGAKSQEINQSDINLNPDSPEAVDQQILCSF